MELTLRALTLPLLITAVAACTSSGTEPTAELAAPGALAKGATLVAKTNLHIDPTRKILYSMNYQLSTLLPVCTQVVINDVNAKVIEFTYQGVEYKYAWEKYTRGAGQSLKDNFEQYFGDECDQAKINSLSPVDREGIESGRPKLGMSKEGIMIAMGRPPIHANPSLENSTWTYWKNRWDRMQLVFDDAGKVKQIID